MRRLRSSELSSGGRVNFPIRQQNKNKLKIYSVGERSGGNNCKQTARLRIPCLYIERQTSGIPPIATFCGINPDQQKKGMDRRHECRSSLIHLLFYFLTLTMQFPYRRVHFPLDVERLQPVRYRTQRPVICVVLVCLLNIRSRVGPTALTVITWKLFPDGRCQISRV